MALVLFLRGSEGMYEKVLLYTVYLYIIFTCGYYYISRGYFAKPSRQRLEMLIVSYSDA